MISLSAAALCVWLLSTTTTAFTRHQYSHRRTTRLFLGLRPQPPPLDSEPPQPHPPESEPPMDLLLTTTTQDTPFFADTSIIPTAATTTTEYELQWSDFRAESLRHELQCRNLDTAGSKDELVARLEASDQQQSNVQIATRWLDDWLFQQSIQKGVPVQAIQGAAVTAAVLGAVVGKGVTTAGVAGLGAAYVAITPGPTGDVVRTLGNLCYNATTTVADLVQRVDENVLKLPAEVVLRAMQVIQEAQQGEKRQREKAAVNSRRAMMEYRFRVEAAEKVRRQEEEKIRLEMAARLAEEARVADQERLAEEAALIERARALEKERQEEEARQAEEERIAEEARLAEEAGLAEEARIAEEVRLAEEARIAEEVRLAEEARIAEEARLAEEARIAEEARLAEEARIAEEARLAEESRLAEEAKLAQEVEDAKIAEEARLAAELYQQKIQDEASAQPEDDNDDDLLFFDEGDDFDTVDDDDDMSDEDWQASIKAAQQSIDGTIAGMDDSLTNDDEGLAAWEAAEKLAIELEGETFNDQEDDVVGDLDVDMEALAKAARAAVADFEFMQQVAEDEKTREREEWAADMPTPDKPSMDWSVLTVAQLRAELETRGLPATGTKKKLVATLEADDRAMSSSSAESSESMSEDADNQPRTDWSALTVANLRAELKDRGLPTAGKKAELISRLEQNDAGDESDDLFDDDYDDDNEEQPFPEETVDWSELTVGELLSAMDERGLVGKGMKKAELIEALHLYETPSEWDIGFDDSDDEKAGETEDWSIEEPVSQPDYSSMTVAQLKEELRRKGLSLSGRKADLIARLSQ